MTFISISTLYNFRQRCHCVGQIPGCEKMPDIEISHKPLTHQSKSSHSTMGRGVTRSDLGHDNTVQQGPC